MRFNGINIRARDQIVKPALPPSPHVYRPVYTNNLQIACTGRAWPPESPVQSDGRSIPPRQTNRISSKRPYLYVVGIIQAGSRFRLICKRDTQRFSASRTGLENSETYYRCSNRMRDGGFKASSKVSNRIFRGKVKIIDIYEQALIYNRIQNYPIRLTLTRS